MAHPTRTVIELQAGELVECDLLVRRVDGKERLSGPFAFTVDFAPVSGDFLALSELVGAEAALSLRRPDGDSERSLHGILWWVEMTGVEAGKPIYRALIVPKLARLEQNHRSRIFQSLSVPEIVKKVLDEHQVEQRQQLSGSHPPREYCVQYRETDFDFVSRLLEDEGIFYWFEHGARSHVMVMADAVNRCADLPGEASIPFEKHHQLGDSDEQEHLFHLEQEHRALSNQVECRDYDFERPELLLEERKQVSGPLEAEVYEYPAGARDHRALAQRAQLRLEELRSEADPWHGAGNCLRLFPGARFRAEGHEDVSYNRQLLPIEVHHLAEQQESAGEPGAISHRYQNSFTAVEAQVQPRPRAKTARPTALTETATVVGPAGEEVHVDPFGRVKVQFHWDREGTRDDLSSCWVRVGQAWAGAAWGAQVAPRIGQEVLVKFLEGDPDQPIVVGAIYNGLNRPPIYLPLDKTKSTFKSDSSLGGGGSNELRFEDAKDLEEIYLHAQKDEQLETLNHKSQQVRANEALQVGRDRSIEVEGHQQLLVRQDDRSGIGKDQQLSVDGDRTTEVREAHTETVGALQTVTVGGDRDVLVGAASAESVGAAAALTVGGAYAVSVGGVSNTAVGGLLMREVGGARIELVGGAREELVAGDSSAKVGENYASDLKEGVGLSTEKDQREEISGKCEVETGESASCQAKEIRLEADKLSIVVGGKLALSVDSAGNVRFGASKFSVDGTVALKGASLSKLGAGAPEAASASVKKLEELKHARALVKVKVTTADGEPVANTRVRIEMPDGSIKIATTDAQGNAAAPSPRAGQVKVSLHTLDSKEWDSK